MMMGLQTEFVPPSAPFIFPFELPAVEAEIAKSVGNHLGTMRESSQRISAAVALFQFSASQGAFQFSASQGRNIFLDWADMAGRDGAMSLRNFAVSLSKVRSLVGRFHSWPFRPDTSALKVVETKFHAEFPFVHKMRHSVAHPEAYSDPTKKMGFDGPLDIAGIHGDAICENTVIRGIIGHTFHSTFEGTLVHYDISSDTALLVVDITRACFAAFEVLTVQAEAARRSPQPR